MINVANLISAFDFLRSLIQKRLSEYSKCSDAIEVISTAYINDESMFARFVTQCQPTFEEYVIILLALVPHLQPDFLNKIIAEHLPNGGDFPEFGGVKGTNHRGILPTGETAQFILAGDDLEKRLEVQRLFSSEHWFAQKHILWLEPVREGEPVMSGRIVMDAEVVEQLTTGVVSRPRFGIDFPAERLETEMDWNDLVLHSNTERQIREIEHWVVHHNTLLQEWGMHKKIKPGFRTLFHGPPGTGKTLTATLLGKQTGKDVYRIDLSRVVSKYIGETEKSLAHLFDRAENKEWILFFDEADALFGKRTDIRDAHDKYANQEIAYLLQRVETFNGLVILASNQRANIDDAFTRRFQSIIHFPMPRAEERLCLWCNAFPPQIRISPEVDWNQIASRYELSGANIMNVIHYCAIEALADASCQVDIKRLELAILREFAKEGKLV